MTDLNLTRRVASALESLETDFNLSTQDFPWGDFKENLEGVSIDIDDDISLNLPRNEDCYFIKYRDIFHLLEELRSAKLIDNLECITKNRYLIRVHPVFSETQSDFHNAMDHIESDEGGAFVIEQFISESKFKCRVVDGFTVFGVMVSVAGNYDKYFPPVSHDDIFVEIQFSDILDNIDKARKLLKSYIFELSSSLGFDIAASPRPDFEPFRNETSESRDSLKFRPLLFGKGISEPLDLYIRAIESLSSDIKILYFLKSLEFISQTVIRINLTEKARSKLLSKRALDPDAEYIRELGEIYENNKIYKKDRDAIKLTLATCCDATELTTLIPGSFYPEWEKFITAGNPDKALHALAYRVTSTRNYIAHAKANYELTGGEISEEEFDQLSSCLKLCVQQAIRWYAGRRETQRIW